MFLSIQIWITFFLCALTANANIFTEEQENHVENLIQKIMECRNIPGIIVSVVRGTDSWSRGFGLADMETRQPVDNSTMFQIGSLSKAMTMTLLGRMLQENGFDWNTKLRDLPNGEMYEFPPDIPTREVTIADLLTHRTGLSSVHDYGFIAGYPEGTSKEELVREMKFVPTVLGFREGYVYNNFLYMVLGHVTETLGGDSWENLITSHLLQPIGMTDSSILESSNDVLRNVSAKPYILRDGKMQPGTTGIYKISPLEPAGSVMSTGVDILKWMDFNLNNGTTSSGEAILEPSLISQAYQNQIEFSAALSDSISYKTPIYPFDDVTSGYGYAWFVGTYRGHKKIWHSGGLFSYVSLLWIFPDDNIGIYASINGPAIPQLPGRGLRTLFCYISDLLLGFEPWIESNTACTFPAPWENSTESNSEPRKNFTNQNMSQFVGTYVSSLLPDVTISRDDNSAGNTRLKFEMNRIKGHLYPTEKSMFVLDFEMEDPWEYAIERVVNENFIIRYPTEFIVTTGHDVMGFNMTFPPNVVIPFIKQIVPEDGPIDKGNLNKVSVSLLVIFCFIKAMCF